MLTTLALSADSAGRAGIAAGIGSTTRRTIMPNVRVYKQHRAPRGKRFGKCPSAILAGRTRSMSAAIGSKGRHIRSSKPRKPGVGCPRCRSRAWISGPMAEAPEPRSSADLVTPIRFLGSERRRPWSEALELPPRSPAVAVAPAECSRGNPPCPRRPADGRGVEPLHCRYTVSVRGKPDVPRRKSTSSARFALRQVVRPRRAEDDVPILAAPDPAPPTLDVMRHRRRRRGPRPGRAKADRGV